MLIEGEEVMFEADLVRVSAKVLASVTINLSLCLHEHLASPS